MTLSYLQIIGTSAGCWSGPMWRAVWQGGLLLLGVWGVCRIGVRIPPQVRCWLWRLAYAKLLLTLIWVGSVNVPVLHPARKATIDPATIPQLTSDDHESVAGQLTFQASESLRTSPETGRTATKSAEPENRGLMAKTVAPAPKPTAVSLLFLVWAAGVMAGLSMMFRHFAAARALRWRSHTLPEPGLADLCRNLANQFGCKRSPEVRISSEVSGPVLAGLWNPILLIPASRMSDPDQTNTLTLMLGHELAHLRRRDLVWNLLMRIIQLLFFFHPLVWVADREHRLAREMACDEMAISLLDCRPLAYAEMLVQVVSRLPGSNIPSLTLGIGESFHSLKARLEALDGFCRRSRKELAAFAAFVGVVAIFTLVPWKLVASTEGVTVALPSAEEPMRQDPGMPEKNDQPRRTDVSSTVVAILQSGGHRIEVQNRILAAAGNSPEELIFDLQKALADGQENVRNAAVYGLSALLQEKCFLKRPKMQLSDQELQACVKQLNGERAPQAAIILGYAGASAAAAVDDLKALLATANLKGLNTSEVREKAALALWRIDHNQTALPLSILNAMIPGSATRSGPNGIITIRLQNAVSEIRDAEPGEPLVYGRPVSYWLDSVLQWRTWPGVMERPYAELDTHAREALKEAKLDAVPFILRYAWTNSEGVVLQTETTSVVRWSLGLVHGDVESLVLAALNDSQAQVRINAMESLHLWSKEQAMGLLDKLKHDPNPLVQQAASRNSNRLAPFNAVKGALVDTKSQEPSFEGKPLSYWLDQFRFENRPKETGTVTNNALPLYSYKAGDPGDYGAFFDFHQDLDRTMKKLVDRSDPFFEYLSDKFPDRTWDTLVSAKASRSQRVEAFISGLNSILTNGTCIYDSNIFAKVRLSPDTMARMSNNPTGADLVRLNRKLLNDAGFSAEGFGSFDAYRPTTYVRTLIKDGPEQETAQRAFRELGFGATPFILRWDWKDSGRDLMGMSGAGHAVNRAFAMFSNEDKDKLAGALPDLLQETDPQVRASVILSVPLDALAERMTYSEFKKMMEGDPDPRVRAACRQRDPNGFSSAGVPWSVNSDGKYWRQPTNRGEGGRWVNASRRLQSASPPTSFSKSAGSASETSKPLAARGEGTNTITSTEPAYEGKQVRFWMDELNRLLSDKAVAKPEIEAVQKAFRTMGTNAVPLILKWEWKNAGGRVDTNAPNVVIEALKSFTNEDKAKLARGWFPYYAPQQPDDRQSVASLIVACPGFDVMDLNHFPKSWKPGAGDPSTGDPRVDLAFRWRLARLDQPCLWWDDDSAPSELKKKYEAKPRRRSDLASLESAKLPDQVGSTNRLSEPVYEGKPVSYWLDILSAFHRFRTLGEQTTFTYPEVTTAGEAFRHLGLKAVDAILQWQWGDEIRWTPGSTNMDQEFTWGSDKHRTGAAVVNMAFMSFTDEDKGKLAELLPTLVQSDNTQVTAAVVASAPWNSLRAYLKGKPIPHSNDSRMVLNAYHWRHTECSQNCPWWSKAPGALSGPGPKFGAGIEAVR